VASTLEKLSDAEIERILREGRIVHIEEIGVGVTRPQRIRVELDGITLEAAFKSIDERIALAKFSNGETEANFTDSYYYERAAYLLDRALGLNMVPVAVLRKVRRFRGALSAWIDGAVIETERRKQKLQPPEPTLLKHQRDIMYIFDALIGNTDRNAGNQLTTPADWKLHLIDHSRSFRRTQALPKGFQEKTYTIPRALFDRMSGLDMPELKILFKGVLGTALIKPLLGRRDRIIEKIQQDRVAQGDAAIFQDTVSSVP
jgi:hypothetical protein